MNTMKRFARLAIALALFGASAARSQEFQKVVFPTSDGGEIHANLYGQGKHAVVLAHGGVFNKESWHPLAVSIAEKGTSVLAIDFRGYGDSRSGKKGDSARYLDLLAALEYLSEQGKEALSLLGGSMGGAAAAEAASRLGGDDLAKLVLLAPAAVNAPKKLPGDKLFIVTEGDRFRDRVEAAYRSAREPKRLEMLEGDAHAQHIFKTRHGVALTRMIVDFLAEE